jgi:hypothetical protein
MFLYYISEHSINDLRFKKGKKIQKNKVSKAQSVKILQISQFEDEDT